MTVRRSSNHIPSSPAGIKQGIVTILGADCDRNSKAGSIRKTLSADMSSKKWLEQNGFLSPMKKIVSSQEIVMEGADHSSNSSSSESEEEFEENPDQDEIWRSIQSKKECSKVQKPANNSVWDSILTQKSDSSLLTPPYVFTPVKRSVSSLSEKSLEICTESLGSETGSDCFSSYGEKDAFIDGDEEREDKQSETEEVRGEDPFADVHVVKYKNSPVRPFPPPLPSIAGSDGASLHMHSHRENGRLVLEAVSVAPRNYFHAQRKDGRLVLTLMHAPTNHAEEEEKVFDDMEGVEKEEEEEREGGGQEQEFVMEQNLSLPTGMISVHKSGLVMKKLVAVGNINPKWSNKFSKGDDLLTAGDRDMEQLSIPQSLPPRPPGLARLVESPPPTAASSFNPYEYFWRSKPTIPVDKANQDLVLSKASKTEQFVPYVRGCKEARRSLIWEPFCIATS